MFILRRNQSAINFEESLISLPENAEQKPSNNYKTPMWDESSADWGGGTPLRFPHELKIKLVQIPVTDQKDGSSRPDINQPQIADLGALRLTSTTVVAEPHLFH